MGPGFSQLCPTTEQGAQTRLQEFLYEYEKKKSLRVTENWNRLPTEAVEFPTEVFKTAWILFCVTYSKEHGLAGRWIR